MDIDFIMKADQRFTFISFCFAYINYKKNEKVHLPISMDSTASALQMFSALLLDDELAKSVNVIPDNNDRVCDIYTEMLEPINENIINYVKENPEYKNLELIKLKRKNVKTPLMTISYNSSAHGRSLQLASTFKKIKIEDIKNLNKNELISISNQISKPFNFNNESDYNLDLKDYNTDENNYFDYSFNLENNLINGSDNEKEVINYYILKYFYEVPSKEPNKVVYLSFK
jgi:DNA-directed RNA polymerase